MQDLDLWHHRLGHASASLLKHVHFLSYHRLGHASASIPCHVALFVLFLNSPDCLFPLVLHMLLLFLNSFTLTFGGLIGTSPILEHSRATWTYLINSKS